MFCQRCPSLSSASDYTILLVPQSAKRLHRSGALHLLALSTQDVTPPTFVIPPYVNNVTVNTFTLNVELDEPGETVFFWTLMHIPIASQTVCKPDPALHCTSQERFTQASGCRLQAPAGTFSMPVFSSRLSQGATCSSQAAACPVCCLLPAGYASLL